MSRISQLNIEVRDLCAELEALQAKALSRVEECENCELENDIKLPEHMKDNFHMLRRLITRV